VLRRLIDDPHALAAVAGNALEICHFDPDGTDKHRAPRAKEDCEAACYDCLMSYYNQGEHRILDRKLIRDELLRLAGAIPEESPASAEWADLLQRYPRVFGASQYVGRPLAAPDTEKTKQSVSVDPDLFATEYVPLLEAIAAALPDAVIEPGGDVISGGRVTGSYFAEVISDNIKLRLITDRAIIDAITASET